MPIIYGMTCKDPTKIYFGSSVLNEKQRLKSHYDNWKSWKNGKGYYCATFELFDIGDVEIHIILECPDDISRLELRQIEQIYIDNCECINICNAYQSKEQRREHKKQYMRKCRLLKN